ncbi:hypothetical protein D9V86_08760 [Bacteroidetes/Chlorobi group bacterium ChocPot_Mid]|nr:MAG: hypothetical protein D9V86_08760 [Bacteroidetes/Chlorobi group bacterium ChocPot_Mid]
MSNNMMQKVPLWGVPALWLLKIQEGDNIASPSGAADAEERLKFDNLEKHPELEIAIPGNVDTKWIEIPVADESKIKFAAIERHMSGTETENDGVTPKDITPTTEQKSGYGKLSVSVNEADRDSESWGECVEKIKANLDAYWLIVTPMPFSYTGRNTTGNAEGFFYFIGKLSDNTNFAVRPLNLTFEAVICPHATSSGWSAAVTGLDFSAEPSGEEPGYIPLKGIPTFHITPEALTSGEAATLKEGKIVAKKIS